MPILKILIVLILFFLPFGEIIRIDLGNNIYVKPIDCLAALLMFAVIWFFITHKNFRSSLKWHLLLFPCIGFLSLLLNSLWLHPNELITASFYLIRWIGYASIFPALKHLDEHFKKRISTFLLIDGFILLVIGYFQFFLYPNLKNLYYLGWDEHMYRLFTSFLDPNFAGAFFVLYFLFVMGLFSQKQKHMTKKAFILWILLLFMTLIAIFLTYSRSALIMLIVSGITFFLLLQKKKLIFLLLALIGAFVIIISPFFYVENINLFRIKSSLSRLEAYDHASIVIRDHPIFGVGFNAYRYAQERYKFNPRDKYPSHSEAGVDSSLLFVFATTGVGGLCAYLFLWWKLILQMKTCAIKQKNIFSITFLASTAGIFVNSLFINSLFFPAIMLWFWVLLGLASNKTDE
jgi:O-antigen ligase